MNSVFKNILIAVDLENSDSALIEQGQSLATAFKSKLWLLHVAAPDPDFVGYEVGPKYIRDTRAETLREEHRKIRDYMESLKGAGIACEGLLIQGPTVEMIQKEISNLKADLLIMGEHKHGFLYDTFIGHTSSRILKDIRIPVLIIPILE